MAGVIFKGVVQRRASAGYAHRKQLPIRPGPWDTPKELPAANGTADWATFGFTEILMHDAIGLQGRIAP